MDLRSPITPQPVVLLRRARCPRARLRPTCTFLPLVEFGKSTLPRVPKPTGMGGGDRGKLPPENPVALRPLEAEIWGFYCRQPLTTSWLPKVWARFSQRPLVAERRARARLNRLGPRNPVLPLSKNGVTLCRAALPFSGSVVDSESPPGVACLRFISFWKLFPREHYI